MCGLFGVISNNVSSLLSSRELDNILLSLRHRGPDGSGFYINSEKSYFNNRVKQTIDYTVIKKSLIFREMYLNLEYSREGL